MGAEELGEREFDSVRCEARPEQGCQNCPTRTAGKPKRNVARGEYSTHLPEHRKRIYTTALDRDHSFAVVGHSLRWLTMVPYICGGVGLVVWGVVSDRMNERRSNLLLACIVSTAGLVMAGITMGTVGLVGMSIAAVGFYGSKGPFWAMPPMFLTGTAAAAAIAWINSIGNLGGFFGPWYVGVMKDVTGSFSGGLYGLALLGLISAFVCAFFLHIPTPRVLPAAPARAAQSAGE